MENDCLESIIDNAIFLVSSKTARIRLKKSAASKPPPSKPPRSEPARLSVSVCGGYQMNLVLLAEWSVFRALAESMKQKPPEHDAEIADYTTEFFNILCGRIVSAYNQKAHAMARFGIPSLSRGGGARTSALRDDDWHELCYDTGGGLLKLRYTLPRPREPGLNGAQAGRLAAFSLK